MSDSWSDGVLDTSVVIDFETIPTSMLPRTAYVSTVTVAELAQGPYMARDPRERAQREERLRTADAAFPNRLPFDDAASRRYGSLVALTVAAGRNPRPRRLDLMIAATASANGLPLFTRNAEDLRGLEPVLEVVAV